MAQTDFLFQKIETLSTLFSLLSLHLIVGNRNNYAGKIKVDKEHQDHEINFSESSKILNIGQIELILPRKTSPKNPPYYGQTNICVFRFKNSAGSVYLLSALIQSEIIPQITEHNMIA